MVNAERENGSRDVDNVDTGGPSRSSQRGSALHPRPERWSWEVWRLQRPFRRRVVLQLVNTDQVTASVFSSGNRPNCTVYGMEVRDQRH